VNALRSLGELSAATWTQLDYGLRLRKIQNGATTYYLRSSILGGQVVAEISGSGNWTRGYVYAGSKLLAVQQSGVFWVHEDPITKSKRVTDVNGNVVSSIELDPWGADTARSNAAAFQPKKFTSYDRDANGSDEAMFRRYNRKHSRFDQPDPYDGTYDFANPQSLNRYAYTQGDPVNFIDPSGLNLIGPGGSGGETNCVFVHGYVDDVRTLLSAHCMTIGGSSSFDPGGGPGDGNKGDRPPTNAEGKGNPNCIQNAVSGATGLARPFGNVGPTGSIGHDGIHVVAPAGSRVTTLAALTGTVLGVHNADEGRTHIVDVLLDKGGFVALYKDLVTVNVRPGQRLGAGSTIGMVGAYEGGGLHFALLNGGRAADQYYRSLTSTNQTNKIKVDMFTNPNGPNSPVNCPGVPVNNAGVKPHP
jgi:RHS repeat-associated protein